MPQCKAFGCFNERSKIKKSFFNFPRPDCSVQARNTCQAWLLNLKNASLPRKIDDYVWKRADLVCEDHFAPDSFDRINGTFASELAKSLNYRQKKRLKPDAVPTIVNTSCVDKTTGLAVRRRQRPLSEAASVSATAVCRRVKRKVLIKAKIKPICSAPISSAESSEPAATSQCEKPAAKRSSSGKRKRLREDSPVQNSARPWTSCSSNYEMMDSSEQVMFPIVKIEIDIAEEPPVYWRMEKDEQNPKLDQLVDGSVTFSDLGTSDMKSIVLNGYSHSKGSHVTSQTSAGYQPATDGTVVQQPLPSAVVSAAPSRVDRPQVCQHGSAAFIESCSLEKRLASSHGEGLKAVHPDSVRRDGDTGSRGVENDELVTGRDCQHVCDVCSNTFTTASDLDQHKVVHTDEKPFMCGVCSKAFILASDLKQHKLVHIDEKPSVCDVCSKAFILASDLEQHKLVHIDEKSFMCEVCSKVFTRQHDLKRRSLIHTGLAPFACSMCSVAFLHAVTLETHNNIHIKLKPFVCDVCSESFSLASHLKEHMIAHANVAPFMCDLCGNTFCQVSHLKAHKMIHSGEKCFVCDVCNKAFTQAGSLTRHKMIHSGDKPFACDWCSKAFTQASHLKTHRMIHSGEKPFVCDVCSKAVATASHLKAHKVLHTGEEPFVCCVCKKSFTWASSLRAHERIHAGGLVKRQKKTHRRCKPFVCDVCTKAFAKAVSLTKHMRFHHNRPVDECAV